MPDVTPLTGTRFPLLADVPDAQGSGANVGFEDALRDLERWTNLVFANVAARTAAFALAGISPVEGMLSYLQDVNRYERHTGTAWIPLLGGVLARGRRGSAKNGITTESPLLRIDGIPLVAGRLYEVAVRQMRPFSTTATDTYRAQIRFTASGVATTASPVLIGAEEQSHRSVSFGYTYTPSANETLSVLLTLNKVTGPGTFTSEGEVSNTEMLVFDHNFDAGDTGVDL